MTGNGILTNTGVVYKKNDLVAAAATDRDGNADFLCYTEAPGVEYDYTAGKIRKGRISPGTGQETCIRRTWRRTETGGSGDR